MHKPAFKSRTAILLAGVLFAGLTLAADALAPSRTWRIELNGTPKDAGEVQLRLTPHDGSPIEVTKQIARGRGEIYIAQDLRDALKTLVPPKRFTVDIVAGQVVLIKARGEEPEFTMELTEAKVPGSHFHLTNK